MAEKITDVENGILTLLNTSTYLTSTCRTIARYHGEISTLGNQVGQVIAGLPACYVAYTGSDFSKMGITSYDESMQFSVVVIAKHMRGNDKVADIMYPLLDEIKSIMLSSVYTIVRIDSIFQAGGATPNSDIFSVYTVDLVYNSVACS